MDLDDSFTEKLLQRNRARKEFLFEKSTEVSSSRKRAALVEEEQIISGSKDDPLEDSPKRHCADTHQVSYNYQGKGKINEENKDPNSAFIPLHAASKTKGLAALKRNFVNGDEDYLTPTRTEQQKDTPNSVKSINISPTKVFQQDSEIRKDSCPADDEYSDESINEDDFAENYDEISSKDDNDKMDYTPLKIERICTAIEKQPSVPVQSSAVPVKKLTSVPLQNVPVQDALNTSIDPAELPLSARKALFENALLGGTPKLNENSSNSNQHLSVAQRAAMFENANKVTNTNKSVFKEPKRIVIPNFSKTENSGSPVKSVNLQSSVKIAQPVASKSPVKVMQPVPTRSPVKTAQSVAVKSPVKAAQPVKNNFPQITGSPSKKVISPPVQPILSPSKNIGSHTRLIQQKLMENSGLNLVAKDNAAKAVDERKQEISSLVNHWEKLSSSSVENNSESERNPITSEELVTYESDSVQEHSEYEDESVYEDEGVEEEGARQKEEYDSPEDFDSESVFDSNQAEIGSIRSMGSNSSYEPVWSTADDTGSVSSHAPQSAMSSVSHSGVSSYSVESHCNTTRSQSYTSDGSVTSYSVTEQSEAEEVPSGSKDTKDPSTPLMYTVSFYRKQKQEAKLTPVRTIVRRENVLSPESPDIDFEEVIQEKIKAFQEDVLRQQTVISQTSQALNLCSATAEFSGSTEQVEGERLLLIATQKRQALLNEIQRLKSFKSQGEQLDDGKGKLVITDMQLPLKAEFMARQLEGRGNNDVHYFLCLIRHGAQVIVTQMVSTDDKVSDGALCFTNHIKLQNLPADFSVVFEVYALQTKKEVLPHEKKYHIRRDHSKIRLTPKGKKSDSKHTMPAVSSPGGPNAVRSPTFGVVGFTRFTLQNYNRKSFTLDKVLYSSPLEGILKAKLQLHAEHKIIEKGFLTMFEEVGGFGAWHRRWCLLDSNHLAYWKYPDDENKKEPIGVVDLKQCVTAEVKQVSRDVCARPHTFQVVTVRPQAKGDKNTLISRTYNTLTTTKFLLSADTKEERILWCNKLNEALSSVRKWDPQALRPVEALQI